MNCVPGSERLRLGEVGVGKRQEEGSCFEGSGKTDSQLGGILYEHQEREKKGRKIQQASTIHMTVVQSFDKHSDNWTFDTFEELALVGA
ncbi:hypothetical protein VNI00_016268 [Paramarasmius palmivorus]|uniref:Uncharacterized protein n=1 Tax=Paramarasmius palmivorus TaxID=297713 RepID=A0AAW0BGV6_9AGAR